MNRLLKLDRERRFYAAIAGIALGIPAFLLVCFAISALVRNIF